MPLPTEFTELAARIRNWGRWGDDDRLGTLNLIDEAAVLRGRDCIRTGRRFSLAWPLQLQGLQIGSIPGRVNPLRTMVAVNHASLGDADGFHTSDDVVTMGLQAGTHWDGLAHAMYQGTLYNGVDASTIDEWGSHELGIERVSSVCSRGILADVARVKGLDRLDEEHKLVTGEDLDAAMEAAGVTPQPGDVLLIRTGFIGHAIDGDVMTYNGAAGYSPGPGFSAAEWFHDHDIAAVATDTLVFEVFPSEYPTAMLAVHLLDIVEMGLTQGQNWNLEALAADCAADGVYDFFLAANPEPFVGGCGSPVNPVAIK